MNPHPHTPTLSVIDPRALAIRSVGYCRHPDEVVIEPRITRQILDGAGRLVASWDPRLWGTAPQPNLTTVYGLSGQPVLTDSVDAGWQLSVLNQTGLLHSFWDARGNQRRCEYDDQQRPVAVTEQGLGALPCVVDRFTYSGADAVDAERNQCGRLIRHDNPASSQIIKEYGLTGAVLVESSSYLIELELPDWPLDPDARDEWLEDEVFTTRHSFHSTGEIGRLTDAMGNVRTFGYDVSGKLSEAWLLMAGQGKQPQQLVRDICYNALDQIESETAGNGVVTRADYAADDGRLVRLVAVGSQKPLQDLNYVYDPVGNIVELEDKAQSVSHFNNQRIDPVNRYRYDSLYQLIEAKGWEVANPSHGPALPELQPTPLDPNQRRNYTQRFEYDAAGNLITRHHSGAPGFSMFTSTRSNRSLAQRDDSSLPGEPDIDSGFDACGNQRELLRSRAMTWDVRNQLSRVALVKRINEPDDYECYFYDRPGHRVRKVNVSQTIHRTLRSEVRYLHSLEIHRHADGEEHHVIRTEAGRSSVRALHWPNGARADQLRCTLGDHLRSSTLELDEEAGVLTREHYYPFGGTACWAGQSSLAAKYKTTRYSGKERDATGLYYYGHRYYAPWLQRWISPDPAGHLDGLNAYAMVGNNPINYIDRSGLEGERAQGTQMLGGVVIMSLLALIGAGIGGMAGSAQTGLSAGALVGGALFALMRWQEHQQSGPEANDRQTEEVERKFGADIKNLAFGLAKEAKLTDEETNRFADFAYGRRNAFGDDGVAVRIFNAQTGKIYGYAGPAAAAEQAWHILSSEKNPALGLKRLGHSAVLLRDPSREHLSRSEHTVETGCFESGNPVSISARRQRRGGLQVDPSPAFTQHTGAALHWVIDTRAVNSILDDEVDPRNKSIKSTVGHLREGRAAAVNWHRHQDGLWSADLHGFPGSTSRGAYRLMLRHEGGRSYKVMGVRDPH